MDALGGLWCGHGGLVLNVQPLNLLRHPRPVYKLEPLLLRSAAIGLLAGGLVGATIGEWQQTRHEQLLTLRAQLQAQVRVSEVQQTQQLAMDARVRLQAQWAQRSQAWQGRRQQLMQMHEALGTLAQDLGLRLERWQGDGRTMVLQAWLPHAEAVPQVLSRLSTVGPSTWTLQSLGDRPGAGVDLLLQAPWPGEAQEVGAKKP